MSTIELNFIVLAKVSEIIVGNDDQNIQEIRNKSSASVSFSGDAGVERFLSISGTNTQIGKAVEMVAERISKLEGSATITLRLLVPNSQCGPLIGKGGQKIKEIRELSGTKITVPSETLPGSSERAVEVTGNPPGLGKAAIEISKVFIEFPARQNNVQFVPQMYSGSMMSGQFSSSRSFGETSRTVRLPNSIIGSVIGKGGEHLNEIRKFSGAEISISESEPDDRMAIITISGTPGAVSSANFLINARISASRKS